MSVWDVTEAALNRWIRASTGLNQVMWPYNGRPLANAPSAVLSVVGQRDFTIAGNPERRTPQAVSWLLTLTAGPGTHSIDILTGEPDPVASTSVTLPGGTSIEDARDALVTQATTDLADLTVAAVNDDSLSVTGTVDLLSFHVDVSASIDPSILASPQQVLRTTPSQVVITVDFRSPVVAGLGTARLLADAAKDGMRDWDHVLRRTGYRFGATLRDTPGYEDDLVESRHMLDVQLLGYRVTERVPYPWVRSTRNILSAAGTVNTATTPE